MSKFDFDCFTGDYPVAVSKERYTEQLSEIKNGYYDNKRRIAEIQRRRIGRK